MRHQKKTVRLGRKAEHRKALLANQVCNLIEHQRIKTTLAKAKAVRPLAEKMVTLGKNGSIHARRTAFSTLRHKDAVKKLFDEIAPRSTPKKNRLKKRRRNGKSRKKNQRKKRDAKSRRRKRKNRLPQKSRRKSDAGSAENPAKLKNNYQFRTAR